MSAAAPGTLGALRLIGDSFRLLFRHFGIVFPLAFAPALIVEALNVALIPASAAEAMEVTLGALVAALVGALVGFLVIAVLCLATLDALTSTRRGLGAYLRAALPHVVTLFVGGMILSVAAAIAMVFFILPGLYVIAQFLVWIQAVVFEGAGLGGLGRAQALTRGYRWRIVGALIVLSLLFVGGIMVTVPIIAVAASGPGQVFAALASAAFAAFTNALVAIFTTLVYLRLRAIRDGVDAAAVAAAFRGPRA